MSEYASPDGLPRLASAPSTAPLSIPDQAGVDAGIPTRAQVWRKDVVHKRLFRLPFDMDQQAHGESAARAYGRLVGRSAPDFVFQPQVAEAVVFQPLLEFGR